MNREPVEFKPSAADCSLQTLILYCSLGSTTKKLSHQFYQSLLSTHLNPHFKSLDDFDLDQLQLTSQNTLAIFFLPSYNVESPVDSVLAQFNDALHDFRFSKDSLSHISYTVIGIGHLDYLHQFCKQAHELDQILEGLGAKRVIDCVSIDVSVDPEAELPKLLQTVIETVPSNLTSLNHLPHKPIQLSSSDLELKKQAKEEEEEEEGSAYDSDDDYVEYSDPKPLSKADLAKRQSKRRQLTDTSKHDAVDIEDLGVGVPQLPDQAPSDGLIDIIPKTASMSLLKQQDSRKEMVSPMTRKSLTKQGYAIVGSHSAVKTCRWTKASLRGRGFCYKHSFYGISHF